MQPTLYWLNFLQQPGSVHLGACIVTAPDAQAAVLRADSLGIHPGGQVVACRLDRSDCDPAVFEAAERRQDVLLDAKESTALFQPLRGARKAPPNQAFSLVREGLGRLS